MANSLANVLTANGDVVNKVGTLAKAVCAREFGVPFYVAVPPSTFVPIAEELAFRALIGQQVSVKAAASIHGRFLELFDAARAKQPPRRAAGQAGNT